MKKIFIAVLFAAMVAPVLTSCDKDTRKCYEIKYKVTLVATETNVTIFKWVSANELEVEIEELKEKYGDTFKLVSKNVAKEHATIEDCTAANVGLK